MRNRMPAGTDELFLFTLVGAVIGGGRAAFLVWFLEHGTDVTQASLSDLRNKLQAAISLIRQGFPN